VWGFATGQDVEIEVIAELAVGYHRRIGVFFREVLELGVELVVDDSVLFKPAYFAFGRADFEEAATALDDFEGFAVRDETNAVGDGGDTIVQIGRAGSDVDVLMLLVMEARATGQKDCRCEQPEQTGDQAQENGAVQVSCIGVRWTGIQMEERWHRTAV
jgi:hypothetical protein